MSLAEPAILLPEAAARSDARVAVMIPAHNEAADIETTIASVREQTVSVETILVVADNCTDATAEIAKASGAEVLHTRNNEHLKAGALNQGLAYLLSKIHDEDYVLIMDADSRLTPEFVESALAELLEDPTVGAVCASFVGEADRRGLIHLFQRSEYHRFARSVARRRAKAQVLSGVATVFPVKVLKHIQEARSTGVLPEAPGIYDVTAATEDIEMTFAVRRLGYRPLAPKKCRVYTDTMSTWRNLVRQRIRWQRGMLDALRLYRLNRQTQPYAMRLLGMYVGSLIPPLYLVLLVSIVIAKGSVPYQPIWLSVMPIFIGERIWSVRRFGLKGMVLAALLLPEWLYDNFRSVVYWVALIQWSQRTERVWHAS